MREAIFTTGLFLGAVSWFILACPLYFLYKKLILRAVLAKEAPTDQLTGKIAIVTGSNCGIGFETAKALGSRGCTVVLACRHPERGTRAEKTLNESLQSHEAKSPGHFVYMNLDLSSLESVEKFCKEYLQRYGRLDILVNNAGLNAGGSTADGFDLVFGVNFLGHYYLTQLLLPLLRSRRRCSDLKGEERKLCNEEPEARIVNLASVMHHNGHTDWLRALKAGKGIMDSSYASSKLAMVVYTYMLNGEFSKEKGVAIRAIAANPGAVQSEIWRFIPAFVQPLTASLMNVFFLTPQQGCSTSVAAACDELEKNIVYLQPYLMPSWGRLPFEVVGPYVGAQPMDPWIPGSLEEAKTSLAEVCDAAIARTLGKKDC
eukprot:CAMPEP_0114507072 /NCGR_PEP_ID=MMETSP0109-20121206/11804_1 /TAXON_ID=29199 /ORGANISM="Chlorarachnion reptans, Strain CCCM449" /LENGTH=372 /DNA_ID=CAMNT_0001685779 /DNA_START=131 /DNA_END=1249 /DNA_ORIENTATION=-